MEKRLLRFVAALVLLAPVVWAQEKDTDKEKKTKVVRILIHANKTKKLGAGLHALHLSGGTLFGVAPKGGVVVEVPADAVHAAEQRLKKIEAKVSRDNLPRTQKVNRLILTYKKDAKITAADLKKKGFKLIERHEAGDTALLSVESIGPLTAARVTTLTKDPDLRHAELDLPVSIPPPKNEEATGRRG